jgi:chemotaxis protein MotB
MGKKKDAHHGGAWKVAYADFVTAMMALFIVLWIIAPDPNDNKIVFEDEIDTAPPDENEPSSQGGEQKTPGEKNMDKVGEGGGSRKMKDLQFIADELIKMLKIDNTDKDRPVDVKVINETIKVTLFDRQKQPFFQVNSTETTEWGDFVLKTMSFVAARHEMLLLLDGHTSRAFGPGASEVDRAEYSPWELSVDRAVASRRKMIGFDLKPDQIVRVSGYADKRPLEGYHPTYEEQRRITIHMAIH